VTVEETVTSAITNSAITNGAITPAEVRPLLAKATADSLDEIQAALLDAAVGASSSTAEHPSSRNSFVGVAQRRVGPSRTGQPDAEVGHKADHSVT
jgi:hypothetical protein